MVVEKDVVDSYDLFLAQSYVGGVRVALMKREANAEVRVVIKVRARRDYPVNEASLNQRNQSGDAESRWRQSARNGHADRHIRLKHLLCEKLASLAQTRSVISQERIVNQIRERRFRCDRTRVNASSL